MKMFHLLIAALITILSGCSKGGNSDNNSAPSNLVVTATVSTDNSGNVSFAASANNAVSFDFTFGDGGTQIVQFGIVTHKYVASGTYTVTVVAKSASGQTISKSTQVTVSVALALIWSDEFDTPGAPDPSKWGYDIGDGCPANCGWGNSELQYYTNRPDNSIVSGSILKIIAKAENYNGKAYTSARLLSKNKFSFKYGKVEVRAKLPAGVGTWPAIWTLGNNINTVGWPACGEMDIMEHRGSELNKIFGTLHYPEDLAETLMEIQKSFQTPQQIFIFIHWNGHQH